MPKLWSFKISQILPKILPTFRVLQFLGVKIMGRKKKFSNKKILEGKFFGGYFYFSKYLWGSFSYFTVCIHINFTCTRSNSEGVRGHCIIT